MNDEEVVELSPFTVNAEDDDGYVAANTLAGSRLNTALVDTAASIDVLTAELIRDVAATSVEEALEWATNSSNDIGVAMTSDNEQFEGAASRINIRGLQASRTRNYLPIAYSADSYNIDRVEENRGPNNVLFGVGSAAGIINVNTKKARVGNSFLRGSLTTQTGEETGGGFRATVDVNQSLNNRLALRVNAVKSDLDDTQAHHAGNDFEGLHVAGVVKITDNIIFTAESEWANENSVSLLRRVPRESFSDWLNSPIPGFVISNTSQDLGKSLPEYGIQSYGGGIYNVLIDNNSSAVKFSGLHRSTGSDTPLYSASDWDRSVNIPGSGQVRTVESKAHGANLSVKLAAKTYLELNYGHSDTTSQSSGLSFGNVEASPDLYYRDGVTTNPYVSTLYVDGAYRQFNRVSDYDSYRATLSHELDFDKWGNYRVALLAEQDDEYVYTDQRREKWVDAGGQGLFHRDPRNARNDVYRRLYFTDPGNWESYAMQDSPAFGLLNGVTFDDGSVGYSAWRNQSQPFVGYNTYQTGMISLQARYLENRLILGMGYRYDTLEQEFYTGRVNNEFNERVTDLDSPQFSKYIGRTKTLGTVYHLNDTFRLMFNYSDNFGLPHPSRKEYPDFGSGNPTGGEGYDFGIGFRFLDNRIAGRLTRFKTDAVGEYIAGLRLTNYNNALSDALVFHQAITGVSQADADAMFIDGTGGTRDKQVEGYELSVTAKLTKNWRLTARLAYTEGVALNSYPDQVEWLTDPNGRFGGFGGLSFYENPAWANLSMSGGSQTIGAYIADFKDDLTASILSDGVSLPKNIPWKANLFTRYTFSDGMLKGLYVGGGVRYQDKPDLGYGFGSGGALVQLFGTSYVNAEALLGYSFRKVFGFERMSVQLNVKNLLDDDSYLVTRRNTNGDIAAVTYPRARLWRLTANFEF